MELAGDKASAAASGSYDGVGHSLKTVRERLGLSIADVSARIRVRRPHLEAIERGRFQELPGPVYVTGFLRSYAEVLGLDPEHVVSSFQAESDVARQRHVLVFPIPRPEQRTPRFWIVLLALVIAAAAYGLWFRFQESFRSGAELVKPLPARMADLLPNPTPIMAAPRRVETASAPPPPAGMSPLPPPAAAPATLSATGAATTPPAVSDPAAAAPGVAAVPASPAPPVAVRPAGERFGGPGVVEIRAEADSWIQVRSPNAEPVFTRLMLAGERFMVPERGGLTLATGNAGGLVIYLRGQPMPRIGEPGEVKRGVPLDPEDLQAALKTD